MIKFNKTKNMKKKKNNNNSWFYAQKSLVYSIIFIYLFITLVPLFWVISTSFKPNNEAISFPPELFPENPTIQNYIFVLTDPDLARSIINSLIVSIGSTLLSVGVSALAGYAFARFNFRAKNVIMSIIMGLFMIPVVINIIPLYIMMTNLSLLHNLISLIFTFQILIIPLNIFLLKNYFETIPKELEEAALIDGCSRLGVLRRVTLPLALPGFAISAVLAFRFSWNEFVLPIVLANRPDSMVFQVALYQFVSLYRIEWGYLTAGINLALIPVVVLMLIFQKQMVRGLTLGAIKE